MNLEIIREYCISKEDVTEGFPFGEDTLVFKVKGRIFALVNLHTGLSMNLKCDPVLAIELREIYSSVLPGYHMNKMMYVLILLFQKTLSLLIY
jgi:predicted DNA-binding protein (MmcQ/YjbR family)